MLDCMATCRGTDKKPCGNIMKESAEVRLLNPSEILKGGDSIFGATYHNHEALSKKLFDTNSFGLDPESQENHAAKVTTLLAQYTNKGNNLPLCQVTGTE